MTRFDILVQLIAYVGGAMAVLVGIYMLYLFIWTLILIYKLIRFLINRTYKQDSLSGPHRENKFQLIS